MLLLSAPSLIPSVRSGIGWICVHVGPEINMIHQARWRRCSWFGHGGLLMEPSHSCLLIMWLLMEGTGWILCSVKCMLFMFYSTMYQIQHFVLCFLSFFPVWNQAAEGPLGSAGPGSGSGTWSSHADSPHVGEAEQYLPGSGRLGLWALWASQASQVQRAREARRYLPTSDGFVEYEIWISSRLRCQI